MPEVGLVVDISDAMDAFESLGTRQQRNVMLAAKRAAGTILRKKAATSTRFNDRTGALRRSLKSAKSGTRVTRNKNLYIVAGLGDEDPFYARFVEFGHGAPRPAPPKRFMEGAIDEAGPEAIAAFGKKFNAGVERQLKRRRRR